MASSVQGGGQARRSGRIMTGQYGPSYAGKKNNAEGSKAMKQTKQSRDAPPEAATTHPSEHFNVHATVYPIPPTAQSARPVTRLPSEA